MWDLNFLSESFPGTRQTGWMATTNSTTKQTSSNWEAKVNELLALESIFCAEGECEIISPSGLMFKNLAYNEPSHSTPPDFESIAMCIQVHYSTEHVDTHRVITVSVTFDLGLQYPQDAPTVTAISSEHLPKHVTDCIHKGLSSFVTTQQPEPCLFEAVQWIKDELTKIVTRDPQLLSNDKMAGGKTEPHTTRDDLVNVAMVDQTEKLSSVTSKDVYSEPAVRGVPSTHVCIAKLDHMRNEQKYLKLLNSRAKELLVYGKILHTGSRSIYVVITGSSASPVTEFLKRWRTYNVDIDSQGRPCKERLLSVLCQKQLSGFVCSWSAPTGR